MTAMCPGCRAILEPGDEVCAYCGWNLRQTRVRKEGGEVEKATKSMGGVVNILIFANVVLLMVTAMLDSRLFAEPGASPLSSLFNGIINPRAGSLVLLGGQLPRRVLENGEVWRLACPMFLHGGLLHIGFNMMFLKNVGGLVVESLGTGKALAIYLLTGLGGSAAHMAWWAWREHAGMKPPDIVAIGASTSLFGFIGLLMAIGIRIGGERGKSLWVPMLKTTAFVLVLGFLFPMLDNAGHIGGLVAGLGFGFVCSFGVRARGNPDAVKAWDILAAVLCILVVASFVPAALDVFSVLRLGR
ncbi:MAG: rhomboid family intramembrane serine protease [Planctomycetota bacterium]|jgi:rhomboid protease GluP